MGGYEFYDWALALASWESYDLGEETALLGVLHSWVMTCKSMDSPSTNSDIGLSVLHCTVYDFGL